MPSSAEVQDQLTGPGGMFEVVTEEVLGRPTQVYANRMPSLRSVAEVGLARGDDPITAAQNACALAAREIEHVGPAFLLGGPLL